ncbi:FkbM family methyltransferase [Helicobacter canis]|uniref:FkbM family methyltransferase n=1 Tax=Helicobacter canis TaxID=29419 RepID=UPI002943F745|nr:FkbM family methyltransferase [Helicobacter canis]
MSDIILRCGGVVHSFEPNPFLFKLLESKYTNCTDVILHNAALSTQNGQMELHLDSLISQGSYLAGSGDSRDWKCGITHQVKTIDLCEYLQKILQEVPRIYFLKIDIEGAEFEIMHKLLDIGLHEKIEYIACETHERYFSDGEQKISDLRAHITSKNAKNILLDWI